MVGVAAGGGHRQFGVEDDSGGRALDIPADGAHRQPVADQQVMGDDERRRAVLHPRRVDAEIVAQKGAAPGFVQGRPPLDAVAQQRGAWRT